MVSTVFDGPSDETWTHDLLTPSQARYQLRHTRKSVPNKIDNAMYIITKSDVLQ